MAFHLTKRDDLELLADYIAWVYELTTVQPHYYTDIDSSSATIYPNDNTSVIFFDDRIVYARYHDDGHNPTLKAYDPYTYDSLDDMYRELYKSI